MYRIGPAGDDQRDAAWALLCGSAETRDDILSVAPASFANKAGDFPLEDLLIAQSGSRMIGAALAVRRPGKMAFVWPPVVVENETPDDEGNAVARTLLHELGRHLDARGTQFAQSLLQTDDQHGRILLTEGGFPYLTDLLQLSRTAASLEGESLVPIEASGYTDAVHRQFAQVMERTFQGTLDCPALARVRDGTSALDALRGDGRFGPALWEIIRWNGADAGVLLCADHPERRAREIVYLGVVPEARGAGIGKTLVARAIGQAHLNGCKSVEVAVDAGNRYALEIYRRFGFNTVRRMAVHLRLCSSGGAAPG